jgi:hypothetical protein
VEALLARYLDGDLGPEEADRFLKALENDPALEARLRKYERLLNLARALPMDEAPAGFTEEVLEEIQEHGHAVLRARRSLPAWLAVAASIALVFAAGRWSAERQTHSADSTAGQGATAARMEVMPASWVAGEGQDAHLMAVRLVYVPTNPDVKSVSVAGSFNDWDPQDVGLRHQGGVWSTLLVLPQESYEYMFVEDGKKWVCDPHATLTRDDGYGGKNAVLDLRI